MAFNLISIKFTAKTIFFYARVKVCEFEKFYNWNFMFYEDSSIIYSEKCSPFYPHEIAEKTLKTFTSDLLHIHHIFSTSITH